MDRRHGKHGIHLPDGPATDQQPEGRQGSSGSEHRFLPLQQNQVLQHAVSREFLRRYERMPQVKKAELIEGVVYLGSPVSVRHSKPGPPELIVEVAASSAPIDLRDKCRACCRNGVREYLVWLVTEARLGWFCLEDDDYRPQLPDAQGVLHSRIFPGLRLPVAPLLAGDTAKVLAALAGHEPLNRKPPETSINSED